MRGERGDVSMVLDKEVERLASRNFGKVDGAFTAHHSTPQTTTNTSLIIFMRK